MTADTGAIREGRRCAKCRQTEARCAYLAGCCPMCSHWRNWTEDGHPTEERAQVVDLPTSRRREQWRSYYRRRVS